MATETVVPDHSAPSQEVEKEVVKKIEAESGSHPPTETHVESTKTVESACESEAKIVDEEPKTVTVDPVEEKVEDKAVAVEVPPVEDVPVVEASDKAITPEPTIEKEDCSSEEKPEKQGEGKGIESNEGKLEEAVKVADAAEPLPAVVIEEKGETPAQVVVEAEATEAKDEAECKLEETTKVVPVVEEQSEVVEQVEKETPKAEAVEEVEAKSPIDESEGAKLPKEEEICASEAPVSKVDEEKAEPQKEQPAIETVEVAEKLEEKSVVAEELIQCEEKATEDAKTSVPQAEPAEEVAKDKATSREVELVADNGIEKCEIAAPTETSHAQVEEVKETPTEAAEKKEQAAEAEAKLVEEKQVDEKIKETVEPTVAKLDEAAETVVQTPECTKEEVTKEDVVKEEVPKEEVPVKTQKQSIVKIVKQSLVKAKKAIIGKSHNSKTPAPEAKDDGNK